MKKILSSILILSFLTIALTSCTVHQEIDIIEKYGEYFDFSLGDYEVMKITSKERGITFESARFGTVIYKEWTIQYKNHLGETNELKINNDGSDESDFYEQIYHSVKEMIKNEYAKIDLNIDSNYFNCTEGYLYWSYKHHEAGTSITQNETIKTKKIKLYEFDVLKLKEYDIRTAVSVEVEMLTEMTDIEIKAECIRVFDQYAEIFGKDYLDITFNWGDGAEPKYTDLSYNGEYIWR